MISSSFGTLAFINPWVLAGLLFLPALWFLLRVTPPGPRLVRFPATRFLAGLIPEDQTSSKTPWWILLLRIMVLSLVILALAGPVLNPGDNLSGKGPVRIVMDNSWAAAQTWPLQTEEAQRLISRAGRENRELHILTTAPEPGQDEPAQHGPLTQAQAEALLRGLIPLPWPADYNAAEALIKDDAPTASTHSYWLGHGLQEGDPSFLRTLQNQGGLTYIGPDAPRLPILLRPDRRITTDLRVMVSAPKSRPSGTPVTVNALNANGQVLDSQTIALDVSERSATVTFDIPETLRGQITQIRTGQNGGAGGLIILDDQFKKRTIALVATTGAQDTAPLIEETYYIERALEPYAYVTTGTLQNALDAAPDVIILANIGAMPASDLNALERWVQDGGLLLRFAGPNMTQGENFLIPVPLLEGGRAMDGALTWNEPVRLAPFAESSPLFGLRVPPEIEVRRQLLAEPVPGLETKSWAVLEDGTPLITADTRGDGLIVLVHTTATPLWSDLSLSGLFVQMLRRIVSLAGKSGSAAAQPANGVLQPLLTVDGHGALTQPDSSVRPIPADALETVTVSQHHPPGLYGMAGYQHALNLGDSIGTLEAVSDLPAGVARGAYGIQGETDLMPWLLAAAATFFLLDWLIMAFMQFSWQTLRRAPALYVLLFITVFMTMPPSVRAQDGVTSAYAGAMYLAYIRSGDTTVDATARQGLQALAEVLARRTSVEPAGIAALNPETDELAFFPLIYWPVAQNQPPLPDRALQNLQYYLDHGGTILIDTRDAPSTPRGVTGFSAGGHNAAKLRTLIGGLDVPPLVPIKEDHVLGKSFYLLDSFPGRYENGTIWIEEQSLSGRDGVSSIIIGSHDWAAAWAAGGSAASSRISGGPRQQEMAMRFGVNLVMYALTGNYKADQVHLPHILERLGQ